jgi:hypothetical protein
MAQLTEWLKLMVAEINRKRDDADRAFEEEQKRQADEPPLPPPPTRQSN